MRYNRKIHEIQFGFLLIYILDSHVQMSNFDFCQEIHAHSHLLKYVQFSITIVMVPLLVGAPAAGSPAAGSQSGCMGRDIKTC